MRLRVTPFALWGVILIVALTGCSSAPRESRKPSVAIVISLPGGAAPSREEAASIFNVMKPEIVRYGYMVAKNPRSADYVVYVRDPVDPLGATGSRITFVPVEADARAEGGAAAAAREFKINSEKMIAEMVRETK